MSTDSIAVFSKISLVYLLTAITTARQPLSFHSSPEATIDLVIYVLNVQPPHDSCTSSRRSAHHHSAIARRNIHPSSVHLRHLHWLCELHQHLEHIKISESHCNCNSHPPVSVHDDCPLPATRPFPPPDKTTRPGFQKVDTCTARTMTSSVLLQHGHC